MWLRDFCSLGNHYSYCQSHPFSLIIWASSIMNLPSLYFWLDSKACSYFHPRVVLQHSQYMSATAWSPVSRTRSSAGPHPTLTTELNKYARPWEPWNDLDISSSWLARCALQCMHEYVRWHCGRYAWNVLTIAGGEGAQGAGVLRSGDTAGHAEPSHR